MPHLIFTLRGGAYTVPASAVREILWLPELTPVEESPRYVAGVLNLRGRIVPVIDLNIRFGLAPCRCRLQDSVIVVEWGDSIAGLIVSAVRDVWDIPPDAIAPAPESAPGQPSRFLAGFAKFQEQIIMLLDLERILRLPPEATAPAGDRDEADASPASPDRNFCPDATPEERAVFKERARSLARPLEAPDFAGLLPLAVARLGQEFFGFPLESVREFAEVGEICRVPCCPPHIVGQVNLRGDILTLVDVRPALQIPDPAAQHDRVVVVQTGELSVGIPVDEVLDVLYLRPAEVTGIPAVLGASGGQYLEGTAPYGSQLLGILDLPKLLTGASLIVNEEP